MKRKIALMTIVATMAMTSVAGAFSDVTPEKWYHREVMELKERGIVKGYTDGTFKAEKEVGQAEALAMVGRSLGIEPLEVESGYWAEGLIQAAKQKGIINSTFRGKEEANREQVAEIIVRGLGLEDRGVKASNFLDSTNKYANILYEVGILKGEVIDGDTYFRPKRTITRAEVGALTLRVVDYKTSSGETSEGTEEDIVTVVDKESNPKLSTLVTEEEVTVPKEPKTLKALNKMFAYMGYKNLTNHTVEYEIANPHDLITDEFKANIQKSFETTFTRYPEYYSFTNRLGYKIEWEQGIASVTFERRSEAMETAELKQKQDRYRSAVRQEVIGLIDSGKITDTMTETQKARVIYDWVLNNTVYDKGYDSISYTGYGQFFNDEAVCQGYVATYHMMLKYLGIEVSGISGIAGTTNKEEHMWSKVFLDDITTYSDPTWGDTGEENANKYFMISRSELEKTHDWGIE